jgi:exosortase
LRGLQQVVADAASRVLDQFGVFHVMSGTVVETGARRFEIESACSGIRSLFTVLAATLFLLLWFRTSFVLGATTLVLAVGWTLAANIARVALTVLLPIRYGIDVSTELRHETFGVAAFLLAVLLKRRFPNRSKDGIDSALDERTGRFKACSASTPRPGNWPMPTGPPQFPSTIPGAFGMT